MSFPEDPDPSSGERLPSCGAICSNVGDSAWRDYDLVVQLKCHILHVLFSISLTLLVSNNLQLSRCFEAGSPALLHEFTYHSSVTFVWCKYKFQLQLRLFLPIWMWTQFLILKAVSFDVFFLWYQSFYLHLSFLVLEVLLTKYWCIKAEMPPFRYS